MVSGFRRAVPATPGVPADRAFQEEADPLEEEALQEAGRKVRRTEQRFHGSFPLRRDSSHLVPKLSLGTRKILPT